MILHNFLYYLLGSRNPGDSHLLAISLGTEPEGITFFETSDGMGFIVALLERASLGVLYQVNATDPSAEDPVFYQVVPTLVGPEGVKKIPGKDAFVIACEVDERENKMRAGIVIYEYQDSDMPAYPFIYSMDVNGLPIPFSALSGLASADPLGFPEDSTRRRAAGHSGDVFSIEDSAFKKSRFFRIDADARPAIVESATRIMDSNDILSAAFNPDDFEGYVMVNDDKTVNIDPEGIALSHTGSLWIANEGRGTVGDEDRPIETRNFIIKVAADSGVIEELVTLPDEVNDIQVRFGFEGVAEQGDYLVVVIQRAWGEEENPRVGIYNTQDKTWKFVFYPLDERESQNGGWVGLSDIAPLGDGKFLVLERDNQGGPDAAIKRLYGIDLGDFSLEEGSVLGKALVRDLVPDVQAVTGFTYEKLEGLAVNKAGYVFFNNDNDGVDDNSGEQVIIELSPDDVDFDFSVNNTAPEEGDDDDGTSAAGIKSVVGAFMALAAVAGIVIM